MIIIWINLVNKFGIINHKNKMVQYKITIHKHYLMKIQINNGMEKIVNIKEYQILSWLIIHLLMLDILVIVKELILVDWMLLVIGNLVRNIEYICLSYFILFYCLF